MTSAEPREDGAPLAEPVVIRDKRRLDPESGEVRPDAAAPRGADGSPSPMRMRCAPSCTADLQRLSAEYANYRKRVDRDRVLVLEMATAGFLEGLLPLLDSVELARQHGDLEGAFKGVGEGLEQLAEKHGLESYGAQGDAVRPGDPQRADAGTRGPGGVGRHGGSGAPARLAAPLRPGAPAGRRGGRRPGCGARRSRAPSLPPYRKKTQ